MKRYEKYKSSGIEWLGEIPEHWGIERIKDYTYLKARIGWQGLRSDEFIDDTNWFCLTGTDFSDGKINWKNCYCIDEDRYNQDKKIQLKIGDLLITKDGTIGKIALVDNLPKPTTLNSGVFVSRPQLKKYINHYMYWVLSSNVFVSFIDLNKNGTTILHLYQNVFERFYYTIPPLYEQTTIANYLDTKTTAIDRKIELLTAKAAKYKALRRSLINETVCRGLNPNVSLKDSGIEWIGMVPEHWEVKRLKEVDTIIMGQSPNSDDYNFELKGYPFLQGNAEFGSISPTPSTWCEVASKTVVINDILVSVRAPIGAVNIADVKYGIGRGLCAIRAKKSYYKFLYYYFVSQNSFLQSIGTGTTYIAISMKDITNLLIAFPPHTEQNAIAVYLDEKTYQIDTILTNIGEQVSKLTQLRKTLINDVVTGKIKVTD